MGATRWVARGLPPEPTERFWEVRRIIEEAMPEICRLMRAEGRSLDKARKLTQTSNRGIARHLKLGEGGSAAMQVGTIIRWWESPFGVRLFAPAVGAESARSDCPERLEHQERNTAGVTPAA